MFFRLGRIFRSVGRDIVVLFYACRNPATPIHLKLLALVAAFYVISPLDVVPDWLALLGIADDVTLIALGVPLLLKLLPQPALQQARSSAEGFLARMRFGRS
ncbi:YkvA family protein [Noviherbaspirillum aridicola]|uniref:DUF1232 domain-containing protein n=1 Tax=Noviherbaspirillum aridicola TaxID=2849687 RepID=A0ABQ4Q807_9BURK|nr:DUF1232 domain-containing protein [Noviherbaspirillum aridicola]GIZ53047.1 hypothetical protein NCCP691_30610 [Noviherbaspirillum aridicola]